MPRSAHAAALLCLLGSLAVPACPATAEESSAAAAIEAALAEAEPLPHSRFEQFQGSLKDAAQRLEQRLSPEPSAWQGWQAYLGWEALEPQFAESPPLRRRDLLGLDAMLMKLRSNQPGLEMPEFVELADALEHYREAAFWVAIGRARDPLPIYRKRLEGLQEQLRRHAEKPTPETRWKIGEAIGSLKRLGSAQEVTEAVEADYAEPNLIAHISEAGINGVASRPVSQQQPVRDTILGTPIRGTAHTTGEVRVQPLDSPDQVKVALHFEGSINSRTTGYRKPVCIYSNGHTEFCAQSIVTADGKDFAASPSTVQADTNTHIRSIRKTGGKVGKKLIEKIAWKKACESKACAEREATQKAKRKVAAGFDEQLSTAIAEGSGNYREKVLSPLTRRNALPRLLRLSSTRDAVSLLTAVAARGHLATDTEPPAAADGDIVFQLHESAVDNVLPLIVGGLVIKQDDPSEQPQIVGRAPKWLRRLSDQEPSEGAQEAELEPADDSGFEPWFMQLNRSRPASVTFDKQVATIRLRAEELGSTALEEPLKNWDLVVSYEVTAAGTGILLRKAGPIDAFPTGFDPEWDSKLTPKQLSLRRTLSGNMNARAETGQGFPAEIPIERVTLPVEGFEDRALVLNQIDCDGGWLTVVWSLPEG